MRTKLWEVWTTVESENENVPIEEWQRGVSVVELVVAVVEVAGHWRRRLFEQAGIFRI